MKRDEQIEAILNELEERRDNICKLKLKIEEIDNDKMIIMNEIKMLLHMVNKSDKNIEDIRTGTE